MAIKQVVDGLFVSFEGLDGSGKSTQIERVRMRLEAEGFLVTVTKEPGGTEAGQRIRELFLDHADELTPTAMVALLIAAKCQMLDKVCYPAAQAGRIVLCDRYTDSLLAYQVGGFQFNAQMVSAMLQASGANIEPDLAVLLSLTAEQSVERLEQRVSESNKLDRLGLDVRTRIANAYGYLFDPSHREGAVAIDAMQEMDLITDQILEAIHNTLRDRTVLDSEPSDVGVSSL